MVAKKLFTYFNLKASIILLVSSLLLFSNLIAQSNRIALTDEQIDLNYNVYYSYSDDNGYLWFSSGKELARFNGNILKFYSSPNNKGIYIQGEILSDADSNIWTSAYNKIIKINKHDNSIQNIEIKDINPNYEKLIKFDPLKSKLWIKSDNKILAFNPHTHELNDSLPFSVSGNSIAINFNNKNEINGLVSSFSHDNETWYYYLEGNNWKNILINNTLEEASSKKVISENGKFYILYNNSIIEASEGRLTILKSDIPFSSTDFSIKNDKIYISTSSEGIITYDLLKKSWEKYECNHLLYKHDITSIKIHEDQFVLFYKNNGIQFLPISKPVIKEVFHQESINEVLINEKLIYIVKADSIKTYDYQNKLIGELKSKTTNQYELSQLFRLSNSRLLGINRLNNFILLNEKFKLIDSLSTNLEIRSILKNENAILISDTKGVREIYVKDDKLHINKIDLGEIIFKSAIAFSSMLNNGDLVTIPDATNISIKLNNGKIKNINLHLSVEGIYHHKLTDELIICTNSNLFVIDKKRELKKLLPTEWIYSNQIFYYCLIFKEYLLIIAERGLYKYYLNTKKLIKIKDINANEINSYSSKLIHGNSKNVILKGKSNLYQFNSEQTFNEKKSILILNEVYINDKLKNNIGNNIVVPFNKNSIAFRAGLIDFSFPNEAHIKYSLIQNDQIINSKFCSSDELINFPSLAPGNYQLNIQGINTSNISSDSIIISITINSPIYERWWFILGMSIFLISIGWYINYIQAKKKLKAQQIEMDRKEAVYKTREIIARDLHDELGAELNKILFLSDEVQFQTDDIEKNKTLDIISKLAGDSIINMREILWVLNAQNESLGKLTTRIRQTMHENLYEHGIKLKAELPPNHDDVILNNEFMKNIHLICKEATNNCIKYAEADEVYLKITYEDRNLAISIKDNGKGFEGEKRSDAYGLDNMKKRAKELGGTLDISSTKGQGVLIQLNLTIPEENVS